MSAAWSYSAAFSRNLGLLTPAEQERVRGRCVAIAGLGGVGGVHLITLARLGVGAFHLADFDHFDVPNFNRQYGAMVQTIGQNKLEVIAEAARQINPEVKLTLFREGLTPQNCERFATGADVILDGIDFFAIDARRLLFRTAQQHGLYALTSGPLGFGATLHTFSPTGMSFERYFDFHDVMDNLDQLIAFMVGLAPQSLHLKYLDLARVDVSARTGPSSGIACQLCSALIGAEAVKILLDQKPARVAPWYFQFDPYLQRYVRGYLWLGNRHPKQRLKRWLLKRSLLKKNPSIV
ncbi:MAG TPA: ThiF family adenylyltransferase [Nitrospiraceae bacterium]|nr:ThiF family adenylyltransferase [Nitrospiraceae bacterium]